jgi:hypothetical protein
MGGPSSSPGSGGRLGPYELIYELHDRPYEEERDRDADAHAPGTWDIYKYSNGVDEIRVIAYKDENGHYAITPERLMRTYEKFPDELKAVVEEYKIGGPAMSGQRWAGWYHGGTKNIYLCTSAASSEYFLDECIVHEAGHALANWNLDFQLNFGNRQVWDKISEGDFKNGDARYKRGGPDLGKSYVSSYAYDKGRTEDIAETVQEYFNGTSRDAILTRGNKEDMATRFPERVRALNKFFGLDKRPGDFAMWDQVAAKKAGTPTSNLPHQGGKTKKNY